MDRCPLMWFIHCTVEETEEEGCEETGIRSHSWEVAELGFKPQQPKPRASASWETQKRPHIRDLTHTQLRRNTWG